jgi:hypothetical protein
MNRNTVLELILIVSVASIWISGVLAYPQYLDAYNTTFSTNASCSICHVNPAGGGTLNSYGMLFQNQTNHASDPSAALITIGQAQVTTPGATTTATSMVTATSTATSIIATPLPSNATPTPTETPVLITTPVVVETQVIATPIPTPTPSTPGFGLGVFIAGLLACYFILKRRNNN